MTTGKCDRKTSSWRRVTATLPLLILVWGFGGVTWGEQPKNIDTAASETLRENWGIEIASLRMSAGGQLLDFRYKVVDPDKAAPLAKAEWKPYLLDQTTGKRLKVPSMPKLGSLRQTAVKLTPGLIYYIIFSNRMQEVKSGSKVTIVVGDCRIENLTVQ